MNELELFRLAKKGDEKAKEKIVSDNMGLVWSVARRFMGRGYDLDEIFQIGCIGLLKAIDRFEEESEVRFSTYAVPLIQGEIKRFLRDNGMIKISRILKQNGYKIKKAAEELSITLGRDATVNEISELTGISVEDIVMATEANRDIESLYQTVYNHEGAQIFLVDKISGGEGSEPSEEVLQNVMVEQAMSSLDEKERSLIHMRYFEDKTQTEVAAALGISQVQVSRLEKKLLNNMRNTLDTKSN